MSAFCSVCSGAAVGAGAIVGLDGARYSAVRCADCGLAWTDPAPQTPDRIYNSGFYAASLDSADRREAEERVVRAQAEYIERFVRRGTFLDVGCGEGLHMSLMRDLGWRVSGVEVSAFAARHARRAHGLDVFHGSLAQAGFAPESFTFVQLRHVIEHLSDPASTLRLVARLLEPGGIVRIDTPAGDFFRCGPGFIFRMLGNRETLDAALIHLAPPMHLFCFTEKALRALVRQCGLRVLRLIRTYHGDPDHYPEPTPKSPFGRIARALDVLGSKLNLGELLVLYAIKDVLQAPRMDARSDQNGRKDCLCAR